MWILILILIIVVSLILITYNRPALSSAIFGSGEITAEFEESKHEKFKDAYNVGTKFFDVDLNKNLEILTRLFFKEPYEEYPTRTNMCQTYPYLKSLILSPELKFGAEDYIFNLDYQPKICYIQQSCKHKNVSYSYVAYTPYNGTLKVTLNGLQTLKYLPIDATNQPYDGVAEKYTCVIVRANPAVHVVILASIFKNVKFIVYDTLDCIMSGRNIEFHKELFGDEHVEMYKHKIDILYCDIYLHGYKSVNMEDPNFNDLIFRDVVLQQDWIKNIEPKYAGEMRFRPPYYMAATYEAQGSKYPRPDEFQMMPPTDQLYGAFSAKASTELRLIFAPSQYKKPLVFYNYQRHDAVCMLHNMRRAWCTYAPGLVNNDSFEPAPEFIEIPDFDRCLDCTYMVNIVAEHIKKYDESNYSIRAVIEMTTQIIKNVSEGIKNAEAVADLPPNLMDKRTPHGMWRDLPRVEAHEKYIELYKFIKENNNKDTR